MRLSLALLGVVLLSIGVFAQSSPKAGLLEDEGWAALRAGRVRAAAVAFEEGTRIDPKNPRMWTGAGIAAFRERRDAEARRLLERALELEPGLTAARVQLAQVQRRLQDFDGAIATLERAVTDLPDAADLRDTLDRWLRERELHSRMRLSVGNHFTVSYEGPEDADTAERVLASLDRAFWRICDVLNAYPPGSVPVVLYTREQFRDVTRTPNWAAGAYDGIIRVPVGGGVGDGAELDRVLAHEFAHALIRSLATRNVPAWLNEGLATALESDDQAWASQTTARLTQRPSLMGLGLSFSRLDDDQARAAYAFSAVAARRLLDEAGGAAVANLLRDLGEGRDFETAFLDRIQRPFAEFEGQLR